MEDLKRILIGERTYPIKIDLNVLEVIQEKYGDIVTFERELLGLKPQKDESGDTVFELCPPSIGAIKTVLPLMVNEGMAIEAEMTGKPYEPLSELQVISGCEIAYNVLADIIHEEFKRCFRVKK